MRKDSLTPKQDRFVSEYLLDLNQTAAARRAGYQGDDNTLAVTGHRLLRNDKVAMAIQKAHAKRQQLLEIDQDYVVQGLIENHQRASQAIAVLDKDGEPTGEYQYQGVVANRSLELLGRHQGLFVDRGASLNVNMNLDGAAIDPRIEAAFRQLSMAEIVRLLDVALDFQAIRQLPTGDLLRLSSKANVVKDGRVRLADDGKSIEPIPVVPALIETPPVE